MKKARIRIPGEKMIAVNDALRDNWPPISETRWMGRMYEDDEAFIKDEHVFEIEGENAVVDPIINAIMDVIKEVNNGSKYTTQSSANDGRLWMASTRCS